MLYSFKWTDDEGGEFDLEFPFGEAPDTLEHDGRPAKRVIRWRGAVKLRGAGWSTKPDRDVANLKFGPQEAGRVEKTFNL